MKALVVKACGDFSVDVVTDPRPATDQLLLRVHACTICGTDMRVLDGRKTKGVRYPSIIGHEIAGVVAECGELVRGFSVGDRVCVAPVIPCHGCAACLEGRENACRRRSAIGYEYDGGFAEYLLVPAAALAFGHLVPIPEQVSFEEAALAEPLACCLNGYRKAGLCINSAVLVVGAGPIGLMHVQLARAGGARTIIVSEPHPFRRRKALEFGATAAIDPTQESVIDAVREMTSGSGVDAVILAIGAAGIINDLLRTVRAGGTINLFAGFSGTGECTIDANLIHYDEITVNGTTAATRQDYLTAVSLISAGNIRMGDLVSQRFPLQDFDSAYRLQQTGDALKIAVIP